MDIKFIDTVSAISVNNGIVKMHLATQDDSQQEPGKDIDPAKIKMKSEQIVAMPIAGFMYSISIINKLLGDPKMTEQLKKYVEAGLLPKKPENVTSSPASDEVNSNSSKKKK